MGDHLQAGDVTLGRIFANDHQNFIPLFQRPYVWDETNNWAPLWEDIKTAVEESEREQASVQGVHQARTYFLGAIVSQARRQIPRRLSSSNVVDGQQRLTTLQTVLSAARRVSSRVASQTTVGRFTSLLENRPETIHEAHSEDRYKVWPLPQDNEAFQWALRTISDDSPPPNTNHKIIKASMWFEGRIEKWSLASPDPEIRMETLFTTLRDRMQLVHIVLDPNDDPQVIFEALNHRGVPLDAADLIKNLLFQGVDTQGDHKRADDLLMKGWLPLDDARWRTEITTGRIKRSRIDVLLSYWLTAQSRQEVSVDHLFGDFKSWLTSTNVRAADVILDIRRHADTMTKIQDLPPGDPTANLVDRMESTGTSTPWPVILYLHNNVDIPSSQRDRAARAIDSFLMRRGVCSLSTGDYNRLFLQILTAVLESEPSEAGDVVERSLALQKSESRRWPTDTEFLSTLRNRDLYGTVNRARIKTFLVGLENHLRTGKTEPDSYLSSTQRRLTIEHILPQVWEKYWPLLEGSGELHLAQRVSSIHKLGNLTLLTSKLNPSISNREWGHKKSEIKQHSLLRLTTSSILSVPPGTAAFSDDSWTGAWDEERIRIRGEFLATLALTVWGPPPEIVEDQIPADAIWVGPAEPSIDAETSASTTEAAPNYEVQQNAAFSTTQMVTRADLETGQIRIPRRSKHYFPAHRAELHVLIEDVLLAASWDPRIGPDRERSGVLRIGKPRIQGLVFHGSYLRILERDGLLTMSADL